MKLKLLVALMLLAGFCGNAQPYAIRSYAIAGGGAGGGGQFGVAGAIGQPVVAYSSGGNYALSSGFWAATAAPVNAGPLLSIRLTATNTIALIWPSSNSLLFSVQYSADISTATWTTLGGNITSDGTNNTLVVNPPIGRRYYRLISR